MAGKGRALNARVYSCRSWRGGCQLQFFSDKLAVDSAVFRQASRTFGNPGDPLLVLSQNDRRLCNQRLSNRATQRRPS